MNRSYGLIILCSVVLVAMPMFAQNAGQDRAPQDRPAMKADTAKTADAGADQILTKIHEINQKEIAMGQLGEQKAQNAKIKAYAQRLVREHQNNDRELNGLAKKSGVTLSATNEPPKSDDADKLRNLSGKDFDTQFIQEMVQGHQDALNQLRGAQVSQPAVKNFVDKTANAVQQHLNTATNIQQSIK